MFNFRPHNLENRSISPGKRCKSNEANAWACLQTGLNTMAISSRPLPVTPWKTCKDSSVVKISNWKHGDYKEINLHWWHDKTSRGLLRAVKERGKVKNVISAYVGVRKWAKFSWNQDTREEFWHDISRDLMLTYMYVNGSEQANCTRQNETEQVW